jgi:hypothetical protein
MTRRVSVEFGEGDAAKAGPQLPDIPPIPKQAEVDEERRLRADAPIMAELYVRRLYEGDWIGVTQVDALRKQLEGAFASPRVVRVAGPGGAVVTVSEAEKMIRDTTRAWWPKETPAHDPDGWIGEPQAHQLPELVRALDLLEAQNKLQPGISRGEAIRKLHVSKTKMEHAGLHLGAEEFARRAGLLRE